MTKTNINDSSIEQDFIDPEIGSSEEGYPVSKRQRRQAKSKKGRKIALTILVVGGLAASAIFGTKAYYNAKETKRVDTLLNNYTTYDYCVLPTQVTTDRAYDITFADGAKLVDRLNRNNINYINIGGQFYTPDGQNIAIITYDVTYLEQTNPIATTNEGQTMYTAPQGFSMYGKTAYRYVTQTETKIVPASEDYSYITFPGASNWTMVGEPRIVGTLPYDCIASSTLICDVPDNAALNENNECEATLALAPKMR